MTRDESAETHSDGDTIACPWCGYPHRNLWDHHLDDGATTTVECGECGRSFMLRCYVSVDYTARRLA